MVSAGAVPESPFLAYLDSIFSGIASKVLVAVIILLIGFIVGKVIGRLVHRLLREIELNRIMRSAANIRLSLEDAISSFVTYFVYFIFIIIALEKLNIGVIAFNMLAGSIMVIIILSIFLSIKDFIPNLISGIVIHHKQFIKPGDTIRVHGVQGRVVHINLVETRIKTAKGDIVYIPNSVLTKSEIVKLKKNP